MVFVFKITEIKLFKTKKNISALSSSKTWRKNKYLYKFMLFAISHEIVFDFICYEKYDKMLIQAHDIQANIYLNTSHTHIEICHKC